MFLIGLFLSGALAADLSTSMPNDMEALSGSCVQIPCSFGVPNTTTTEKKNKFDSIKYFNGVWIKTHSQFSRHEDNVIFNGSKAGDYSHSVKIVGNLSQKNCTTIFFSLTTPFTDKYFFRIESPPFKATARDTPIQINVKDEPPTLNLTFSGDMVEGDPVSVTCAAAVPCPTYPPVLKWTGPIQWATEEQSLEENPDRTKSAVSRVTFTPSDRDHEEKITCTAEYPTENRAYSKTAEETMVLNVSYSPKDTSASVSPAGPLSVGSYVTLNCSSRANPPTINFTWFRWSEAGGQPIADGPNITLRVTASDTGSFYYCEARNGLGQQRSPQVQLGTEGQRGFGVTGWTLVGIFTSVLILLAVFGWWRKSRGHVGPERTDNTQGQSQAAGNEASPNSPDNNSAVKSEEPAGQSELHYGEISFSQLKPNNNIDTTTVYAEVKPGRKEGAQAAVNDIESLYAQVKKKH